ncbi:MAG: DHHA1 domain-containing protein [Candidatus Thermoplasmatota archaeon]
MISEIRGALATGGYLILLHANADIDAVSAAAVLQRSLPGCAIAAPGSVSRHGRRLAALLDMEIDEIELRILPQKVVVVDAASPEMLPNVHLPESAIVIDHHAPVQEWGVRMYHTDPTKASCAEVVVDLLKPLGIKPEAALAALYGILADTGGLKHAGTDTFRAFAELLAISGTSAEQVFAFFSELPEDISERIARLKGAQRMRFERTGEIIIGTSIVGAHEGEVCRALLQLGCDAAFVGSQECEHIRVSARANHKALSAGIDLDNLMRTIAQEMGWKGGGHPGAAGLSGQGDAEAATNICVKVAMEIIGARPSKEDTLPEAQPR